MGRDVRVWTKDALTLRVPLYLKLEERESDGVSLCIVNSQGALLAVLARIHRHGLMVKGDVGADCGVALDNAGHILVRSGITGLVMK